MAGSQGSGLKGDKSSNLIRRGAHRLDATVVVSEVGKYHKPQALAQGSPARFSPFGGHQVHVRTAGEAALCGAEHRPVPHHSAKSAKGSCLLVGWLMGWQGGAHGAHSRLTTDLGDDISSELRVLVCFMGQVGGQEVDESLNLMHHGIHVGHL